MAERNVSVIIPTYNRAHVLGLTIPSYLQDVTLEIILIDDGSEDQTKEVVKQLHMQYPQVKYCKMKEHVGLTRAKNAGIYKARGKYLFVGDDDACLYQGTLLRLRDALESYPADLAAANGSYAVHWNQIRFMENYINRHFTVPFNKKCPLDFDTFVTQDYKIEKVMEGLGIYACIMIRTELAKEIKYDTGFIGNAVGEDLDYNLRHIERGRTMIFVPDTYEIDIPRTMVRNSGCHSGSEWKYDLYTIRNWNYFLNKHYRYLKSEGYMSVSKHRAMLRLIKRKMIVWVLRIKNKFSSWIKKIKI